MEDFVTAATPPTPLVLVHGWAGSAEAWTPVLFDLDPGLWGPVTAMRLPHSPGWSGTEQPTIPSAADELIEVLEAQPSPAVIVGHSMGAQITLAAHSRRPDLVLGEIVIDPAYGASPAVADEMRTWAAAIAEGGHDAVLPFFITGLGNVAEPVRAKVLDDVRATSPDVIARYLLSEYVDEGALGIAPNTRAASARRLRPVLALHTADDGVERESALSAPPGSRIEQWRDLSHFLHLERPASFTRLLSDWLSEVRDGGTILPAARRTLTDSP
jgi:pimeloyl-ACP methyl ester carboxylesterase